MPLRLQQELGQILMLAANDFQQRLDADLHARGIEGIEARQRWVFLHLSRFGPSRSVELAQAAGIRPQSMMAIIHELEDLGLVTRETDPRDSRAKLIDVSKRGGYLLEELTRSTETVWRQYAKLAGANNLRKAISTLKHLQQSAEQQA